MEWKECFVRDVSILKNGKKRPSSIGNIPVYGGNGVMDYVNDNNNEDVVLIGRVGAYCGCVHRCEGRCWVSDNAIAVNANESTDINYLFYALKNIDINYHRVGGAQPLMTQDILGGLPIRIPQGIEDQFRISSILSSLDRKIELNNKINAQLEEMAQALFKEWFVDFGPFKDGKFVESELGLIPEGWRVGTLDEIAEYISRGLSPKYSDDSNEYVIGQTCVRNNIVTLSNARKHITKGKSDKRIKQWDVLINSTGVGSLGRVGIVYFDDDRISFDSHLTVVRVKDSILKYYVGRNLLSRQSEIENMAVGSTGQTELPRESVKSIKLIIPSSDSLSQFNEMIRQTGLRMFNTVKENISLSQLRDTLLPKLMNGEIDLDEYEC